MEEQNQNWKDVIYEQVPEKENKPKKNKSKKMKHMKLVVGAAIAAGVLVPAVFGSFYQIQEQEQAVLVTFGKPKAVTETGLHFKLPFIQEVRKVNTTIQGFPVGYTEENNEMVEAESIMITSENSASFTARLSPVYLRYNFSKEISISPSSRKSLLAQP